MPQSNPLSTIVVGAGATGLSCALSAALRGVDVILLEKTTELGGTVNHALIHTIGGLFDSQGNFLNSGLPVELTERLYQACSQTKKRRIGQTWVLNVDPMVYVHVITNWIVSIPNIDIKYNANITDITHQHGHIDAVKVSSDGESDTLPIQSLVDTTGNATIVRKINATLLNEGVALGGFIVQLRGMSPDALCFPRGVGLLREIRKAVDKHELPHECSTVWLDTGVYPDEAYAKFNIVTEDFNHIHMKTVADQLLLFLRKLPGFSTVFIHKYGQLGIRDGGRIKGKYCLTEADIKEGKQFDDIACKASWPIEHWHIKKGVNLEYLPEGHSYDIPLRCLQVSGFSNLWAGGKCLSAEPRAQASARVVGTCWAMGDAMGDAMGQHIIIGSSK